jgi:hypothetical protein
MQTISPPGSVSVIALTCSAPLLKIVRSVMDLAVWPHVCVLPAGMLHIPVEVRRILINVRPPFISGLVLKAYFSARWVSKPIRAGWNVRVRAATRKFVPRMLRRPFGSLFSLPCPASCHRLEAPHVSSVSRSISKFTVSGIRFHNVRLTASTMRLCWSMSCLKAAGGSSGHRR